MVIRLLILSFIFQIVIQGQCLAQRIGQSVNHHVEHHCHQSHHRMVFVDSTYDVHHYHLDIAIEIDNPYIEGSVEILATANENISSIPIDLDAAFTVTNIIGANSYVFEDNILTINLNDEVLANEQFAIQIFYEGIPPLAGGFKGLRYETHGNQEPIIASLSTPFLAHSWWPCNDGTADKADSVFVDITLQDTVVAGLPVIAVSNGILDQTIPLPNNKIQFQWKHRYPIVPYYVMVAISNYELISQWYDNGSENFPLEYYVFENSIPSATAGVEELPEVMDFFTTIFGPYPFAEEKYGMTELGFYGGIENQTNSIINNMSELNFGTVVHELAHMWFADMITCTDWHHGWMNEGFATYATALYYEESEGIASYHDYMEAREYYLSGSVYLTDVSNPFNVFQGIIYNKGAYVLHMLRHVMGDEAFFESLYAYATDPASKYKHANTEDFQVVCEGISGMDLEIFFEQWIYDEYYPQYVFDYYQNEELETQLIIQQTQGFGGWRPVFEMPIDVKITFVDNTDTLMVVQNNEVIQDYEFSFDKEIISITLDPNNWILKEVSEGNIDLSLNTNQTNDQSIYLYPNPSKGQLNIVGLNQKLKWSTIRIFSVQGELVDELPINNVVGVEFRYNTTGLAPGIYFIEIGLQDSLLTKKFVVE